MTEHSNGTSSGIPRDSKVRQESRPLWSPWKRGMIVSTTTLKGRRACSAFVACSALQKAGNLAGSAKGICKFTSLSLALHSQRPW